RLQGRATVGQSRFHKGGAALLPPAGARSNSPSPACGSSAKQPFSRLRESSQTALLPLAGEQPNSPSPACGRRWREAPDEGASAASCSCSNSNRSPVGRVLTRLPFRQSLVGRVLTRRSFADIKIKSFRAVTARATFLCLCKETWRKESTPRPA